MTTMDEAAMRRVMSFAITEQSNARLAVEFLARTLATHRCGDCGGQNEHDVCEEPDWKWIGEEMQRILQGPPPGPEPV